MDIATIILCALCTILFILVVKDRSGKPDGYIVINKSNPEKDTYTLELNVSFGELDTKKKVIFFTRQE